MAVAIRDVHPNNATSAGVVVSDISTREQLNKLAGPRTYSKGLGRDWSVAALGLVEGRLAHVLLLVGGVVHVLYVLLQSPNSMVRNDDVFYYFEVARNFALQGQFTFDGIHTTNGVQPLWTIILSVIAWVSVKVGVSEPESLARVFLLVGAALNMGAGWFLFLLSRKWLRHRDALIVLALWLFTPQLVISQVVGMENALNAFLLALTLYWYYFKLDLSETSVGSVAVFGLLCGFLFLARVDSIVLLALLLPLVAYRIAFGKQERPLAKIAVCFGMCLLPVLPYLAFNIFAMGHLFPVSGAAKWLRTQETLSDLGGYFSLTYWRFVADRVIEALLRTVQKTALGVMIASGFWTMLHEALIDKLGMTRRPELVLHFALAAGSIGLIWLTFARDRLNIFSRVVTTLGPRLRRLLKPNVLLIFAAVQFLVYLVFYPGQLTYAGVGWYFVPAFIFLVMVVSVPLGMLIDELHLDYRRRKVMFTTATILFLVLNLTLSMSAEAFFPSKGRTGQAAILEGARWIGSNLEQDAVIAAGNAGVLGYFAPQTVINIDGLANDFEFLDHKRNGEVALYAARQKIQYVADHSHSPPRDEWKGIPIERIVHKIPMPENNLDFYVASVRR